MGGSVWIEYLECEAIIGENTTFEDSYIAVKEPHSKIHIGKDCMLAYDIELRTGDSHSIIDSKSNERINYAQNINIELCMDCFSCYHIKRNVYL